MMKIFSTNQKSTNKNQERKTDTPEQVTAYVQSVSEELTPSQERRNTDSRISVRPTRNKWLDTICDWPKNLFPSCWCACCCCCGVYLQAQLAEKTGLAKFVIILGIHGFFIFLGVIFDIIFEGIASTYWLPAIYCWILAMFLRFHMINKEHISEHSTFREFCTAFWCYPCSLSQMARHSYGYKKIFDGDSDPFRPDNYGPHQV